MPGTPTPAIYWGRGGVVPRGMEWRAFWTLSSTHSFNLNFTQGSESSGAATVWEVWAVGEWGGESRQPEGGVSYQQYCLKLPMCGGNNSRFTFIVIVKKKYIFGLHPHLWHRASKSFVSFWVIRAPGAFFILLRWSGGLWMGTGHQKDQMVRSLEFLVPFPHPLLLQRGDRGWQWS